MKIGLSYSRCLLDIIEGKVDIDDVLVIISRTNFDPHNDIHWKNIWEGYRYGGLSNPEWAGYNNEDAACFRALTIELLESGKLHQPRQFGKVIQTRSHAIWLEAVLPNDELEKNPSAKEAWENFQVVAALADVKLDRRAG
jgi:hypothetical protein